MEATARFDRPIGVRHGIGGLDLALVAFGVRARRLLRAACRLLDADEPDCASPLLRVMNEYLIVGRWLMSANDKQMQAWALDDLRERRNVIEEVIKLGPDGLDLADELRETEDAIRRYGGTKAALSKRAAQKAGESSTPRLQGMAHEVGLDFIYSFAYRLQSQTDVHATPLAVDSVFEMKGPSDPGPRIRGVPGNALRSYDLYAAASHILIDVLRPVAEHLPELGWLPVLDEATERLRQTAAAS